MKYNILGLPIEIDTCLYDVKEYLLSVYSYFLGNHFDEAKIRYTATLDKSITCQGNSYSIYRNGRISGKYADKEEFLLKLEHIIMDDVMMELMGLIFCSCCCIGQE